MNASRSRMMFLLAIVALGAIALAIGLVYLRRFAPVEAGKPPVPGRSTLGVHTLVGQEEARADAVAETRPMVTEPSGSSFIVFAAGYASNKAGPVDNKGNRWELLGEPVVYDGYDGRFNVRAFVSVNGQGGPDHRVRIVKTGYLEGELTMPVVEIRNARRLVAVQSAYPRKGAVQRSGAVITRGPATLVAFWWGDGRGLRHSAKPDNGFEIIEDFTRLPPNSAVQCVVAVREVEKAGSYEVTWTSSPAQGAVLWLFAFDSGEN